MSSSMLIGFNNDVEFKGRMFHIQTEDHGIKDGHITTILFFSGQILDSKKISYIDDIEGVTDDEERKKAIKKRMVDLHREFYKRLFDGTYEEKVAQLDTRDRDEEDDDAAAAPPPSVPSGVVPSAAPPSGASIPAASKLSSPGLKPLRAPSKSSVTGLKAVSRKGPPPLRPPSSSTPKLPPLRTASSSASNAALAGATRRGNGDGHPAFRGLLWPDDELRIDGLVAAFLESQSG